MPVIVETGTEIDFPERVIISRNSKTGELRRILDHDGRTLWRADGGPLPLVPGEEVPPSQSSPTRTSPTRISLLPVHCLITQILSEAGQPMRAAEIRKQLREIRPGMPKNTVTSALSAHFERVGPGTYAIPASREGHKMGEKRKGEGGHVQQEDRSSLNESSSVGVPLDGAQQHLNHSVPRPVADAIRFLIIDAGFQAARTDVPQLADYWHGYLAGANAVLGVLLGGMGYSLDFLKGENT